MAPPGSAWPPSLCLSPSPTQVPLSCGKRAAPLTQKVGLPCPSPLSCAQLLQGLDNLAVSRGLAARGSALPYSRLPRGLRLELGGGGLRGALFSRASGFLQPCPWEPTLAKEESTAFWKGVLDRLRPASFL